MARVFFIFLLAFLLSIHFAYAAIIHGTVYDLSLDKVSNARVEINTVPKQFLIARNGTYSFNVPNGGYIIKAQQIQKNTIIASAEENITIRQTGSYVLDIILFPDIEEGIEDIGIEVDESVLEPNNQTFFIVLGILAFMAAVIFFFLKNKNRKAENIKKGYSGEDETQKIVAILKKEGGRITQKEIRKEIPLSEAKISLMIAELEHKGIIEKIKKGRGNIIILKK